MQLKISLLFLFAILYSSTAEDIQSICGAIQVKDGVFMFSNSDSDSYTFQINGKNTRSFQKDDYNFVSVNGKTIQFSWALISEFKLPKEIKMKNRQKILEAHLESELKNIELTMKEHVAVQKNYKTCSNGRSYLIWSYKMPSQYPKVYEQLFITTLTKKQVIILNGVISKKEDYNDMVTILENAICSIELKKKPINYQAFQDSVRKIQ